MCLHVNSTELTAKEDIEVFKIVEKRDDNCYSAMYQNFLYTKDVWYVQTKEFLLEQFRSFGFVIEEGFHSWPELKKAKLLYTISRNTQKTVVRCLIKKGSKYYKGLHGDIVSNTIKIVEEL